MLETPDIQCLIRLCEISITQTAAYKHDYSHLITCTRWQTNWLHDLLLISFIELKYKRLKWAICSTIHHTCTNRWIIKDFGFDVDNKLDYQCTEYIITLRRIPNCFRSLFQNNWYNRHKSHLIFTLTATNITLKSSFWGVGTALNDYFFLP